MSDGPQGFASGHPIVSTGKLSLAHATHRALECRCALVRPYRCSCESDSSPLPYGRVSDWSYPTRKYWVNEALVFFFCIATCGPAVAQTVEIPKYVGRDTCLECHAVSQSAHACRLEEIPRHLKSYLALKKAKAQHIAVMSGLSTPPQQSLICLSCHTTGAEEGQRWAEPTFSVQDGVQCESCHGPGSLHVSCQQDGRIALAGGFRDGVRRGNRDECAACHRPRPSHRMVLEEGYRVPASDRYYKTPVNLAISPDGRWLYVACERANALAVVNLDTLKVAAEIKVGRRPHGLAVSPDGKRVWVTNRLSDTLSVIDAKSQRLLTEVKVGHEPHGVISDPSGRRLYVLNTGDDSVSVLDAGSLQELQRLPAGRGPWDAALSPDGKTICVTNVRPSPGRFREPTRSEVTLLDAQRGVVQSRSIASDANMLEGVTYVPGSDVALFVLMRTKNLIPTTRIAQGWTITNGLGVLWPGGRVDQVLLDQPGDSFPDPTDIAVSPDGRLALVTSGGSDRVAVVDVERLLSTITASSESERETVLPNHLGMSERFVVKRIPVGVNPRAVVFSTDGRFAYVANALEDSISVIDTELFVEVGRIDLGGPTELTETRWGERLFHSADNAIAHQFSCRSCHPDGHVNGLTHDIEADGLGLMPVDNRSLRGILDTGPFKWEGTNPSLERQCGPRLAVFFTRLHPFTPTELQALVRYMCTIERPTNHHRAGDGLTLAQRRGKMVFDRDRSNSGKPLESRHRCNTCHSGAYKTSLAQTEVGTAMFFDEPAEVDPSDLYDVEPFGDLGIAYFYNLGGRIVFDVPHLTNVYDSPPYMHNGSARTLEEIWTRFNLFDWHGFTKDLTRRQFNDLIAYLETL